MYMCIYIERERERVREREREGVIVTFRVRVRGSCCRLVFLAVIFWAECERTYYRPGILEDGWVG